MGDLDETSLKIGELTEAVKSLGRSLDLDRRVGDERHKENTTKLDRIDTRMDVVEDTVKPLVASVKKMEPVVTSIIVGRWKQAGALSLASFIILSVGWLVVNFATHLGGWFVSLFHLPK